MNKPTHLIIHHTAVGGNSTQFDAVNNYHKEKFNFQSSLGLYGGYHWFIEKNGYKQRYRADKDEGAHTLGGWNKKSIGVCLAGDFNTETPTEAQIDAVKGLIQSYNLPYKLHREADTRRTCPGKFFSRDLLEIPVNKDSEDAEKHKALSEEVERLRKENSSLRRTLKILSDFILSLISKKP